MNQITGSCIAVKIAPLILWGSLNLHNTVALKQLQMTRWGEYVPYTLFRQLFLVFLSQPTFRIPSEDGAKNGPWKLAWFSVACFAFNSDPSAILYIFNLGLEALMFRKSLCDCCFDSFTAVGKHEQCFTLQLPYYPERKLTFPDLRSF